MLVMGIDPGGTTGVCVVEWNPTTRQKNGKLLDEIPEAHFYKWLDSWREEGSPFQPDFVVCENFILRPKEFQNEKGENRIAFESQWTKGPVFEQIGAIKYRCHQLRLRCVMQEPAVKREGYSFAGLRYKKGDRSAGIHSRDAAAHVYYLLTKGTKQKS